MDTQTEIRLNPPKLRSVHKLGLTERPPSKKAPMVLIGPAELLANTLKHRAGQSSSTVPSEIDNPRDYQRQRLKRASEIAKRLAFDSFVVTQIDGNQEYVSFLCPSGTDSKKAYLKARQGYSLENGRLDPEQMEQAAKQINKALGIFSESNQDQISILIEHLKSQYTETPEKERGKISFILKNLRQILEGEEPAKIEHGAINPYLKAPELVLA